MKTFKNFYLILTTIIVIGISPSWIFCQNQLSVPLVLGLPIEKNIYSDNITITWNSNIKSTGIVRFGKVDGTKLYTDSVSSNENVTSHSIKLNNLIPATIYNCSVGSKDSTGTGNSGNFLFSTASPLSVSGAIWVYFSKYVNNSVSLGENATVANLGSKFVERISLAKYTIDISLYSLSGNVGTEIANELIIAKNRGVKVRFIGEEDNSTTSAMTLLKNSGVPFITDKFDTFASSGLMHNKFGIFDNRNSSSFEDDFIWTGSWNASDPGTNNDAQNVVIFQDVALANAYTREFEEMWGSSTEIPNASLTRFGNRKTNNTPHRFMINNTPVESYFSPSDGTTSQIYSCLSSSLSSINVCVLSFTRDDLSQIIIQKKNQGIKTKVLMDNNSDTGNEYATLLNAGVDIFTRPSSFGGFFHHKYAIVDGDKTSLQGKVVTGSHNWSTSAENTNNENTLIIQSNRIANLFLQEFKARYLDAGGKDNIIVTFVKHSENGKQNSDFNIFPNPANPSTTFQFNSSSESNAEIKIYSISGQLISTIFNQQVQKGKYEVKYNTLSLSSGTYYCILSVDGKIKVSPLLICK